MFAVSAVDVVGWLRRSFSEADHIVLKVGDAEAELMPALIASNTTHLIDVLLWDCHNTRGGAAGKCQCSEWEDTLKAAGVRHVHLDPYSFASNRDYPPFTVDAARAKSPPKSSHKEAPLDDMYDSMPNVPQGSPNTLPLAPAEDATGKQPSCGAPELESGRKLPIINAPPDPKAKPLMAGLYDLVLQKSVLFLGPANTQCGVDPCSFDVVVITNNMVYGMPPMRCGASAPKIMLLVNRAFSSHIHNKTQALGMPALRVNALLLTSKAALGRVAAVAAWVANGSGGARQPFTLLPPKLRTPPLGLSYVLEMARNVRMRRMHVTGVTFYAGGNKSYVKGYELNHSENTRQNVYENKVYSYNAIRELNEHYWIPTTIDFPTCRCPMQHRLTRTSILTRRSE